MGDQRRVLTSYGTTTGPTGESSHRSGASGWASRFSPAGNPDAGRTLLPEIASGLRDRLHDPADLTVAGRALLPGDIRLGNDAHQLAVGIHHRHPADLLFDHDLT